MRIITDANHSYPRFYLNPFFFPPSPTRADGPMRPATAVNPWTPMSTSLHPALSCRRHPLALAALLLVSHAATAQSTSAQSSTAALPAVTVTATMTEQDARTAPASVTVITAEELAEKNATDLLDAVRGAPGITLQGRQVGGRKTLALRGLEGKHTLTLIDGRRISASDDVIGDRARGDHPRPDVGAVRLRGPGRRDQPHHQAAQGPLERLHRRLGRDGAVERRGERGRHLDLRGRPAG